MTSPHSILAVGIEAPDRLATFFSVLRANGFQIVKVPTAEDVPLTLEQIACPVILVYNDPRLHTAHRVLEKLAAQDRKAPVIVLVEQPDFDEYYALICEGAFDYFDLSSDPALIEQAGGCLSSS